MIKKQQKWIALLVICTFIWLMQVSTMPVAAAGTTEQISSASADKAPGFIEEDGPSKGKAKGKSPLPFILIGVGVVALTAVLFLVVLKTRYDIVGTWNCNFTGTPAFTNFQIVFSGDKKSGTWTLIGWSDTGTYTVDGKKVTFQFTAEPWIFTGEFTDKDKMSGNHSWPALAISGTWTATRVAGTSSANFTQTAKSLAAKVREMR
jgi:hypothetical protein